jgi:hypothetical protein
MRISPCAYEDMYMHICEFLLEEKPSLRLDGVRFIRLQPSTHIHCILKADLYKYTSAAM